MAHEHEVKTDFCVFGHQRMCVIQFGKVRSEEAHVRTMTTRQTVRLAAVMILVLVALLVILLATGSPSPEGWMLATGPLP